jgi:hypothetical protein
MGRARRPGVNNLQHQFISFFATVVHLYFNVSDTLVRSMGLIDAERPKLLVQLLKREQFRVDFWIFVGFLAMYAGIWFALSQW